MSGHFQRTIQPTLELLTPCKRLDAISTSATVFFGAPIQHTLSLLRPRSHLRLVVPRLGADALPSGPIGEIADSTWEVRTTGLAPSADLLIADAAFAAISTMQVPSVPFGEGELRYTEVTDEVSRLQVHFDAVWQQAAIVLYENLIRLFAPSSLGKVTVATKEMLDALLQALAERPEDLFGIDPRRFEELVARLLERQGHSVQLTPPTRDGGRDILARPLSSMVESLYFVECKRYAPDRPVGVKLVRALYGELEKERATAGLLVTTSRFTKDAVAWGEPLRYRLALRDYDALTQWLRAPGSP